MDERRRKLSATRGECARFAQRWGVQIRSMGCNTSYSEFARRPQVPFFDDAPAREMSNRAQMSHQWALSVPRAKADNKHADDEDSLKAQYR
jgi:hypothetical protein